MVARIASVHFASVTASRNYRGEPYFIPPVALGESPKILVCRDLVQRDWGPMLPGTQKRQEYRWLVQGDEIARCLTGQWTGTTTVSLGMNPDCHPGIWIIRDRLPQTEQVPRSFSKEEGLAFEERMVVDAEKNTVFREATDEEKQLMFEEDLAHARMADRRYAEWCWNDGNRIFEGRKLGKLVPTDMPPNYKLAARHYGLDADWLREAASIDSRACPSCGKLGPKAHFVCQHCTQPTDLDRWAAWQAQKDSALKDAKRLAA